MSNIGFRVFTKVNRPNKELVNRFKDLPVATIADNMNRLSCMDWNIKPINQIDNLKLLGTAITVKANVSDNLLFHKAILLAEEGDIIVVDAKGGEAAATTGEIMCRYAESKGIKGFVIDGLARDSGDIKKMKNFIVYSKGSSPNGPFKEGPGEVNVPISCGGVVVNPGDIIVGDEDGVISINPEEALEIAEKTEAKVERENKIFEEIEKGTLDRSWIDKKLKEKGCKFI